MSRYVDARVVAYRPSMRLTFGWTQTIQTAKLTHVYPSRTTMGSDLQRLKYLSAGKYSTNTTAILLSDIYRSKSPVCLKCEIGSTSSSMARVIKDTVATNTARDGQLLSTSLLTVQGFPLSSLNYPVSFPHECQSISSPAYLRS